jgi:hypothetical protein
LRPIVAHQPTGCNGRATVLGAGPLLGRSGRLRPAQGTAAVGQSAAAPRTSKLNGNCAD